MLTLMTCALFFFNDTATTEIYTLSLHDALPISSRREFAITNPAECAAAGESSGAIKPSGAHKRFRSSEIEFEYPERCSGGSIGAASAQFATHFELGKIRCGRGDIGFGPASGGGAKETRPRRNSSRET